jgi:hypothetical protein
MADSIAQRDGTKTTRLPPHRADTDWFKEARWGVFLHFLSGLASAAAPDGVTVDSWNARVDAFDAEGLAAQLESIGAGYLGLTVGQNSGYYCSPNAAYDRIVGHNPSRCSRRDLMAEVARALERRGIRFLAYSPSKPPGNDGQARKAFGLPEKAQNQAEAELGRRSRMQTLWEEVLTEWSLRWGQSVSAWWIDGVYAADEMYRHPEPPNFGSFRAALKAGNPDALVAFNPGTAPNRPRIVSMQGSDEDYTAGELDFSFSVPGRWYNGSPAWKGRFIDGAQFHVFSFLGDWWGKGEPRFPTDLVTGYTRLINQNDGVVTWDVPVGSGGLIPEAFVQQLSALRSRDNNV